MEVPHCTGTERPARSGLATTVVPVTGLTRCGAAAAGGPAQGGH
jgi:hypothetical protein